MQHIATPCYLKQPVLCALEDVIKATAQYVPNLGHEIMNFSCNVQGLETVRMIRKNQLKDLGRTPFNSIYTLKPLLLAITFAVT